MRKLIFTLLLITNLTAQAAPINIELQDAKLTEVLNLFMKGVFKAEYIVSNDVKNDAQTITVSLKNKSRDQAKSIFLKICRDHNLVFENQSGVYFITKDKTEKRSATITQANTEKPQETPPTQNQTTQVAHQVEIQPEITPETNETPEKLDLTELEVTPDKTANLTVYEPKYTNPENIQKLLSFSGIQAQIINGLLVFNLPESKSDFIKNLIADFDHSKPDLVIKASLYEYSKKDNQQNAIEAVLSIFKNTFSITLPSINIVNSTKINFSSGDVSAAFKALDTSENFKVLSSPTIRATDNKKSTINIGASVPVLNQIVTNATGQSQQSVIYRDSGITLEVTPKIRQEIIELDILQNVSDFTQTTTGVNTSPTLIQRKLQTTLNCKNGDLILLGGLEQQRDEGGISRFLGIPIGSKTGKNNTDLLLVLHVSKI